MKPLAAASCLILTVSVASSAAVSSAPSVSAVDHTSTSAASVPKRGCRNWDLDRTGLLPDADGPLTLRAIDCLRRDDPMIVSPDGRIVAAWHRYSPGSIDIAWLGQSRVVSLLNFVTFRNFARYWPDADSADVLAWSVDSRFLWSARQKQLPGGFAASGLAPIKINLDGTITALPEIHHPAGPLDGLAWVGGSGLAIGMFGGRGYPYVPKREVQTPTLAMIDVQRNELLEVLPLDTVPGLKELHDRVVVERAAATVRADGRIVTVFQISAARGGPKWWLLWTQGELPRLWPLPHPREDNSNYMALSPDGSKLLVLRLLKLPTFYNACAPDGIAPPPPVTGPIAEYYNLRTRQLIWQAPATVRDLWIQRASPVISADAKYALLNVPSGGCKQAVAILDMASGRVVQTVTELAVNEQHHRFGFTNDGGVWIAAGKIVLSYTFK